MAGLPPDLEYRLGETALVDAGGQVDQPGALRVKDGGAQTD
jgi:hypothetical protein